VIEFRREHRQQQFLGMKNSIIFISALSLVTMMLASCESIPSAYNPFAPDDTATGFQKITPDSSEGAPVPGETMKSHP
jgi:hypothetical protein